MIFFITFLLLYSCMHYYLYSKISAAFALSSTAAIADEIVLVGIDDVVFFKTPMLAKSAEDKLLHTVNQKKFIILLKHRPTVTDSSIPLFDLQLSGHTHQGQIFPFGILVRLLFKYWSGGLYNFGHANLYVSNGAGTWGPPIRFLAPPEITVINLLPSKK